ncbi:hypothetical protein L6164_025003 [Bauhinia variegata]|uniref:Uncharacterized protein n=1 Tax=Bauhinia variegata TaxID=167791 RepID=A0ACB9LZB1_BAUVA|nr:hypothetical protein L6164_025003 [Bauhinia variegata]
MNSHDFILFTLLFLGCASIKICLADFDNLQDACPAAPPEEQTIFINGLPCKNPANIIAQDFITSELSKAGSTDNIFGFSMNIVNAEKFSGLNTLGLSIGRTDIEVDGQVFLHYHPRATEMIFVTKGILVVGFLDTANELFQKFLKVGDVFVFPKGLFHFCLNTGFDDVTFISAFNSQNPGTVSIVDSKFATALDSYSLDNLKRRLVSLAASEVHRSKNSTLLGSDNSIFS